MSTLTPSDPFDGVARIHLDAVPLAAVRHERATLADLPRIFDAAFRRLGALAATGEVDVVGPALAVYHGDPQGVFDLDIGLPLGTPLTGPLTGAEGEDVVVGVTLPPGPAVATSHLGGYEGLAAAWGHLLEESGAEPAGVFVEVYVSNPSQPGDPRTDLVLPLG